MPVRQQLEGDVLCAKEKFIGQQCNCLTMKPHGLSAAIVKRFPYADPYGLRIAESSNTAAAVCRDEPGTIRLLAPKVPYDALQDTTIICLFAQWCPGPPFKWVRAYPSCPDGNDSPENRLKWFQACLTKIDGSPEIDSPVALPFNIGCGLAGGQWKHYLQLLEEATTDFILYKL